MTLSKNRIKHIRSLEQKKQRKAEGLFLAEGPKVVGDLLGRFPCPFLAATREWLEGHPSVPAEEVAEASDEELARASLLKAPQQVLALFRQREERMDGGEPERSLCLALDGVQDPGNLGTIVRVADWFGIEDIFCSPDTADIYNPKSVQATMGSLARVRLHYTPLPRLIGRLPLVPVYGTFLDGRDLYGEELSPTGLVVMGNEGKGISPEVSALVTRRLLIPPYPPCRVGAESLNVAVATAITCAEFRRQAARR